MILSFCEMYSGLAVECFDFSLLSHAAFLLFYPPTPHFFFFIRPLRLTMAFTLPAEFVSESDWNWVTEINEIFVLFKVMAMFIAKV